MAFTAVEPIMADVAPPLEINAHRDEVMKENDSYDEAMRQLEIDIHEEVCFYVLTFLVLLIVLVQGCQDSFGATSPCYAALAKHGHKKHDCKDPIHLPRPI